MESDEAYNLFLSCLIVVAAILFVYRLATAIGLYLRFDHPWATMLATQIVVALLVAIGLAWQYVATYP